MYVLIVLRSERGGENVILAGCTKIVLTRLMYKISRQNDTGNSLFPGLLNDVRHHNTF